MLVSKRCCCCLAVAEPWEGEFEGAAAEEETPEGPQRQA